jgi:hypothetical protein
MNSGMNTEIKVSHRNLTEEDLHMTIEEFKEGVKLKTFTDFDGYACAAFNGEFYDDELCYLPSQINEMSANIREIVWLNR